VFIEGYEMKPLTLAVTIMAALIIGTCGCMSSSNAPTSTSAASPGVGSLQQSVLSVFSSTIAPAVNQSFTVHGTLQDGVSGAPLAGQSITLQIEQLWSGQSIYVKTTTNANGAYTVTVSGSAQGVYGLYPTFAGNPSYAPSIGYLEVTVGNLVKHHQ
jgi:hypothetical protein